MELWRLIQTQAPIQWLASAGSVSSSKFLHIPKSQTPLL